MDERSKKLRRDIIALSKANGGYHYGGTFSCVEILSVLYDIILREDDRFILSKGHACWGYYVLLREKGYNPSLEGHPHLDIANGVHWTTGSEGHGFPAGVGMALARKLQKQSGKVYVLMGDGECQEGTTWESLLMASQHGLSNLVVVVDCNKIQGSGFVKDILSINALEAVALACGWDVSKTGGHDKAGLQTVLSRNCVVPHLVFADTVKGKGVSYMENDPKWHACWPDAEHERIAMEDLS